MVLLLLVAALVSIAARRCRLPSSAGLLLAGLGLAALPSLMHLPISNVGLTQHVLFIVLLPALVFESALHLRARDLAANWLPLAVLVTAGVAINMAVCAGIMHFAGRWPWTTALLFGALTSATDPIAVISTFKDAGVEGRPRLLAEAESLLNDGFAVVALGLVLLAGTHAGGASYGGDALASLLRTVIGGVGIGLIIGLLLTALMSRSDDPLTEMTLTAIGAYGAYYAADAAGGSGILAVVASGIVLGSAESSGRRILTDRGYEIVEANWEFAAFIANALVFLLMGFTLAHAHLRGSVLIVLLGIVSAFVARALAVYVCCALVSQCRWRIPTPLQHILVWGGQRGGLSLVLAVSVASATPLGDSIVAATAGLVAFSILVQGTTFRPFLGFLDRRTGSRFLA